MDINFKKYSILDRFNVSRETCIDFEKFISLIREKNQEINIISKKTAKRLNIKIGTHLGDSVGFEAGFRGMSEVPLGVTRPPSMRFFCGLLMV